MQAIDIETRAYRAYRKKQKEKEKSKSRDSMQEPALPLHQLQPLPCLRRQRRRVNKKRRQDTHTDREKKKETHKEAEAQGDDEIAAAAKVQQ